MPSLTTSDKRALPDVLASISTGKIQLPDFQRGWVWDDSHIRSLLASISRSFPVGAVMMLETGNPQVRFAPRAVQGAEFSPREPEHLLLDGQQRLTSLFQTLKNSSPVETFDARGTRIERFYFFDIERAPDPETEREDALLALQPSRIVRNFRGEEIANYASPEAEYQHGLFPLNRVFNYAEWRRGFAKFWKHDDAKADLFDRFEAEIIAAFESYQIPIIFLTNETPKEAVCQVFEKVNTGGVSLTVFELLTATFAADNFNLRDDWNGRATRLHARKPLENLSSDEFLQAMALLVTRERHLAALDRGVEGARNVAVSAKRRDILKLEVPHYLAWADALTDGFEDAARLLRGQKLFSARDLPYQTQLVPLAAILTALGSKGREGDGVRTKIARWFWCGVFGELYGSATETRFGLDLMQVLAWLGDSTAPEPSTIRDCNFAPTRLETMRSRNSAAYKGLHALLMREGGLDFLSGNPIDDALYFDENVDIHHIFPQKWCADAGIKRETYDSIINKTPISAPTNRSIGGSAPGVYLSALQRRAAIDETRMDTILETHLIAPDALRANDFQAFWNARQERLLGLIEGATNRAIARS